MSKLRYVLLSPSLYRVSVKIFFPILTLLRITALLNGILASHKQWYTSLHSYTIRPIHQYCHEQTLCHTSYRVTQKSLFICKNKCGTQRDSKDPVHTHVTCHVAIMACVHGESLSMSNNCSYTCTSIFESSCISLMLFTRYVKFCNIKSQHSMHPLVSGN
jgi:hypothetical protein